jgi:hypothetical protein
MVMAFERPPRHALLDPRACKTYRPPPEKVYFWHSVRGPNDSLKEIARRHHISLERIVALNFPGSVEHDRMIPEVVNWYLHYHEDFHCPETRDKKNRIFKGGEKIAIPFSGSVEIGEPIIVKKRPVSLEGPPGEPILASQKFVYEFKIPPKQPADLGYLLAQARISVEGEISQRGLLKTSFKKDQIKVALEKKFNDDLKGTFSAKFDQKTLETVANEIKKGSKEGFVRALAAPFEASIKQSYKFGKFSVVPELGAEFSLTPVVVRVSGEYKDTLIVDALSLDGKFIVKIGFNVGLSKKGWAWVAERIGAEAIKRFLMSAGRALTGLWEYLVAEGIVAAGAIAIVTIAATIGLTYLTAWIVNDARRKGELTGLATWYVSAYSAKVFGLPRPSGFIVGDTALRDKLIELGERDAVADARATLRKAGRPEANGTDSQALEAFRQILLANDGGKYEMAKWRLQSTLEQKSQKLAGL